MQGVTSRKNSNVPGWAATQVENRKYREYKQAFTFRAGLFQPLVLDVFGAMGESTLKYMEKLHKEWMDQGNQKVWGKIKTVLSIGACLTYTARLDSAREHIRKSERGKKTRASIVKEEGDVTTSTPLDDRPEAINDARSVDDTSNIDGLSSDGTSAYDRDEVESQGIPEDGCSEDDASR